MSHLTKSTFNHIRQESGRKPTVCNCTRCQAQCHTPCLGTPEDIEKLLKAGYADRLTAYLVSGEQNHQTKGGLIWHL